LFRFADNAFNPSFIHTIGIDFKIKTLDIGKETCQEFHVSLLVVLYFVSIFDIDAFKAS
jgi:hypothetical protein